MRVRIVLGHDYAGARDAGIDTTHAYRDAGVENTLRGVTLELLEGLRAAAAELEAESIVKPDEVRLEYRNDQGIVYAFFPGAILDGLEAAAQGARIAAELGRRCGRRWYLPTVTVTDHTR